MNKKKLIYIFLIYFIYATGIQISASIKNNINISLSSKTLKQGETLRIDIKSRQAFKKGTIVLNKKKFKIFKLKQKNKIYSYYTFIGISRYIVPQKYKLKLYLKKYDNSILNKNIEIEIRDAKFRKSVVKLKGKKKKLAKNKKQLNNEAQILSKEFKKITYFQQFRHKFKLPTKGRLSTTFGAYRTYNGVPSGRHSGVDFANEKGTPIFAANKGKVILSQYLKSHGHTIIIDHGIGILTIYNHLSKRLVKKDDKVDQKTKIALMGSTGISTGSHLHWGMSIQNVRVDPIYWVKENQLYIEQ